jgi:hypothetical protein
VTCTCNLEPEFMVDESADIEDTEPAHIVDAEGERIVTCKSLAIARLVARALNEKVGPSGNCCLEHL